MADEIQVEEKDRNIVGLALGGLAAAALLLFVFQNTGKTDIDFLWFSWQMPKFLLIFVTVALTLIVAVVTAWLLNRRNKKRD